MFDFLKRFFSHRVFEIKLKKGQAYLVRGKVTGAFINDCLEICKNENLDAVSIFGVSSENGIRLEFSSNVPLACCQKFRNTWELHR